MNPSISFRGVGRGVYRPFRYIATCVPVHIPIDQAASMLIRHPWMHVCVEIHDLVPLSALSRSAHSGGSRRRWPAQRPPQQTPLPLRPQRWPPCVRTWRKPLTCARRSALVARAPWILGGGAGIHQHVAWAAWAARCLAAGDRLQCCAQRRARPPISPRASASPLPHRPLPHKSCMERRPAPAPPLHLNTPRRPRRASTLASTASSPGRRTWASSCRSGPSLLRVRLHGTMECLVGERHLDDVLAAFAWLITPCVYEVMQQPAKLMIAARPKHAHPACLRPRSPRPPTHGLCVWPLSRPASHLRLPAQRPTLPPPPT